KYIIRSGTYLMIVSLIISACKPPCEDCDPNPLLGLWKPGTVRISGQDAINFAAAGRPYVNFQLDIQTAESDDKGTYRISGIPSPFGPSFSGTWQKSGTTLNLGGIPSANGFANLVNLSVSGNQLNFTINLADNKTGNLTLNFNLVK
ncbi:MAG: hypothetical protein MUE85_24945, partial [Microscillaceae bacterium]|nr:hypothetical protein [Microscillaceae bacterium]